MKTTFKRKAFTLIELLIVIAIIGILFIVLVSKVDFATDKAKTTGVQTDFRSFQVAFETVSSENAGFNTLGWDTGDIKRSDFATVLPGYTYTNETTDAGDRVRNSYDVGDLNLNGKLDLDETWTGRKIYTEVWTSIYTLDNPGDAADKSAYILLEETINKNLDPKLHITINPDTKEIAMANGYQDPWTTEYHGFYLSNAAVDGKDRGAILMYSNGPNKQFGSAQVIDNGVVTIGVPQNNIQGQDDLSILTIYTYFNGYGENKTTTTGFSQNQSFLAGGNDNLNVEKFKYTLEGSGQTYNKGSFLNATFRSTAPIEKFVCVKVDGKVVESSNYVVREGSTIIEFNYNYFESLLDKEHLIEVCSTDGSAVGNFFCSSVKHIIPIGGKYTAADGTVYGPGEEMPKPVANGDKFEYEDYYYVYKEEQNGWWVRTRYEKQTYGYMQHRVNGKPITDMTQTFAYIDYNFTLPNDFSIADTVRIMERTFYCSYMVSLPETFIIPEGVTILLETFESTSLEVAPKLPSTIVSLDQTFNKSNIKTFHGNTKPIGDMSDYYIPPNVSNLYETFQDCDFYVAPKISNLTNITELARTFAGTKLTNNTLPELPSCVEKTVQLYYHCYQLTDVSSYTIPSSIKEIRHMFSFTGITDDGMFNIPNTVVNAEGLYYYCQNLTDVSDYIIPSSVTNASFMFYGCSNIENGRIVIPSTLKQVSYLFASCTSLKYVPDIPSTVTTIQGMFARCSSFTGTIVINSNSTYTYCFENTVLPIKIIGTISNTQKALIAATANNNNVTYE